MIGRQQLRHRCQYHIEKKVYAKRYYNEKVCNMKKRGNGITKNLKKDGSEGFRRDNWYILNIRNKEAKVMRWRVLCKE